MHRNAQHASNLPRITETISEEAIQKSRVQNRKEEQNQIWAGKVELSEIEFKYHGKLTKQKLTLFRNLTKTRISECPKTRTIMLVDNCPLAIKHTRKHKNGQLPSEPKYNLPLQPNAHKQTRELKKQTLLATKTPRRVQKPTQGAVLV
jgi:hypothetical protein